MQIKFTLGWKTAGIVLVVLLVAGTVIFGATDHYTSQPSFCGTSCHAMDEPYESWKASKHYASNNPDGEQAGCVECHFLPGGKMTWKAQLEGARHLAAYLYDPKAPLPIRAVVPDGACLRSGCHALQAFQDEVIEFVGQVRFQHATHFDGKALEGQTLTCDTCHFKVSEEKHFEVPEEICYLCHLMPQTLAHDEVPIPPEMRKVKFNEGAARCDLCHTVPTKSLQQQISADDPDEQPITHQTLEKAGVACESCHLEVIQGRGAIDTGGVNSNGCLGCHNWLPSRIALELGDAIRMHDKHVATRRADCFDCHRVIRHDAERDYLDNVRSACTLCHEDQHRYQRLLLTGDARGEDISETPSLMHAVKTNCMGCHIEEVHANGQTLMAGSAEACVECHGEDQRQMLEDWNDTLAREVRDVKELEQEALAAIAAAGSRVSEETLGEAQALLQTGRESLAIVEYGNGVHNKKYAVMLIDQALTSFEDLVDSLQAEGE
jgi:nitrate/TMAO reductase-like tetraheme cytochrome c subunit